MDTAQAIYLGRIVKAFGIRGEVKVVASDDYWDGVFASKHLYLQYLEDDGSVRRRPVRVVRARPHGGAFVLKLDGVDDRNGAEAEVGGEFFLDSDRIDVAMPESERPFQVIGREVRLEEGGTLGTIRGVLLSAAHPVYEVERPDGRVALIPAVSAFVVARDDPHGAIVIRTIPGLVDEA